MVNGIPVASVAWAGGHEMMIANKFLRWGLLALASDFGASAFGASALAQVAVDLSAYGVKVETGGSKGVKVQTPANSNVGADVEMEGVAVINGDVYVDGQKVPRGVTSYKSKKTGKTYRIQWGKGDNVSVEEK